MKRRKRAYPDGCRTEKAVGRTRAVSEAGKRPREKKNPEALFLATDAAAHPPEKAAGAGAVPCSRNPHTGESVGALPDQNISETAPASGIRTETTALRWQADTVPPRFVPHSIDTAVSPAGGTDPAIGNRPLFILPDGRASHAIPVGGAEIARLRLLLLDFDGTLADTREANYRAYARTLDEAGVGLTREEYFDCYFGMRCSEFMERMGFGDPADRERLRLRKIALYPTYFDTLRLNRVLWEFAQSFRSAGGRVWIVSTGSRDNIVNAMHHLGIAQGVDGLLTGDDIARSKPEPDSFLRAMEAEGVGPHETLIFEDSSIGLEAARRSGAPYIAVRF